MDALLLPRPASTRDRSWRSAGLVGLLGLLLAMATILGAAPAAARADGPRMLHLPMRWCVLEGTVASKHADAAVLERIRRASSILAPRTGITLRSAINRSLGQTLGFPVIKDPRKSPGRPGDVRTPLESSVEYNLVVTVCEQAWQRMERVAGKQASFGGLAKGPVGVIIRDFVSGSGTPVGNVWGYALSSRSNSSYCNPEAPVRWASGGSLLVVDSRDGHPSRLLDRRLVAHEIGHILRLGHGDGLDNPGSVPGRIDKYCDATENPDIAPGSLMTYTLSYEDVEPWQQRLTRNVAARHPAGMGTLPFLQPRQPQRRVKQLQRVANDGRRIVRRLVPPTRPPLARLPRLWSAGTWGDDFADLPNDVRTKDGKPAPKSTDLHRITVSTDDETGDLSISLGSRLIPPAGQQIRGFVIDVDANPETGGSPSSIPDLPFPKLAEAIGVELVGVIKTVAGETTTRAWRWDVQNGTWLEMVPPPQIDMTGFIDEEEHVADKGDHAPGAKGQVPTPDTMIMTIPKGLIGPVVDLRIGAALRTKTPNGRAYIDTIPASLADGLVSMSTRDVEYPVCAVNRDTASPGTARLGERISLEVNGLGQDGQVSVWLGDGTKPIATLDYWDPPCDWSWVAEVTLPEELVPPEDAGPSPSPPAGGSQEADGSADGLYMLQVVLEGTGLTADCPLIIGDPELPEWFTGSASS